MTSSWSRPIQMRQLRFQIMSIHLEYTLCTLLIRIDNAKVFCQIIFNRIRLFLSPLKEFQSGICLMIKSIIDGSQSQSLKEHFLFRVIVHISNVIHLCKCLLFFCCRETEKKINCTYLSLVCLCISSKSQSSQFHGKIAGRWSIAAVKKTTSVKMKIQTITNNKKKNAQERKKKRTNLLLLFMRHCCAREI